MKKILFILFLFFSSAYAAEVIDDAGQKIKLSHPAQRIISLAPDLTEILFAAGAGNKIVGVMYGTNYPDAAKKIPVVASFNSVDVEKILALHPDLIVAWSEGDVAAPLKKFSIPIFYSHQQKLIDVPKTLIKFGKLAGTEKKAYAEARKFLQQYYLLEKKYARKEPVTVFYEVWPKPLITITKQSWINDMISVCGGKNIFADLKGAAPEVNVESVIVFNPDFIIGTSEFWKRWPQLSAVKNNRVFRIDPDLMERATPRSLLGVRMMCEKLFSREVISLREHSLLPARFLRGEKGRG